jgi:hypothetical protein
MIVEMRVAAIADDASVEADANGAAETIMLPGI